MLVLALSIPRVHLWLTYNNTFCFVFAGRHFTGGQHYGLATLIAQSLGRTRGCRQMDPSLSRSITTGATDTAASTHGSRPGRILDGGGTHAVQCTHGRISNPPGPDHE